MDLRCIGNIIVIMASSDITDDHQLKNIEKSRASILVIPRSNELTWRFIFTGMSLNSDCARIPMAYKFCQNGNVSHSDIALR